MAGASGINNEQLKQQAQYLNMRGAQIAQEKSGQQTTLGSETKVRGSKAQLIGTIAGVVGVAAVLLLLAAFRII